MNPIEQFEKEKKENIKKMACDRSFKALTREWESGAYDHRYNYSFTWMGRPIIQMPNDMLLFQEIVWQVQPDLIIETGIAHGGSIIYAASLLELISVGNPDYDGRVIGIDIDIRKHNRELIENHPMMKRITLLEGSSTDEAIVSQVKELSKNKKKILLSLDSNHTYEHVYNELLAYSSLVSINSYVIVWDTVIETFPPKYTYGNSWGKGNSPMTAVNEFLKNNDNFIIDQELCDKAIITVAEKGFLRRIK